MYSRDNLFFGGIFAISIVAFAIWGLNYLPSHHYLIFLLASTFGIFMAFNIGGNDVANSFGTSVGAKTLTIKQALVIAAIFELSGAMLAGAEVTDTIKKGIIDMGAMHSEPMLLVFVMMGSLLSAATWLLVATFRGLPVSTTHAIVGGILGGGIALAMVTGVDGGVSELIKWDKIIEIVISWVVSPILGGLASYGIYWYLKKYILDYNQSTEEKIASLKALKKDFDEATATDEQKETHAKYKNEVATLQKKTTAFYALRTHAPIVAAFAVVTIGGTLLFKGLKNTGIKFDTIDTVMILATFAALAYGVTFAIVKEMHRDTPHKATLRLFSMLQVLTASAFAFSHGANDIANAVGPFAAIIDILHNGAVSEKAVVPVAIMLAFGVALVAGLWFMGKQVINTIGHRIADIFPVTGFAAELGATLVILVATKMGLPVSSTHILVGAVIGIGMLNRNANWALMKPIALSWIITLPAAMVMSAIFFFLLKVMFGY